MGKGLAMTRLLPTTRRAARVVLVLALWALVPGGAAAYPNLQLYSPQAVYVDKHDDPWFEETWFVPTKRFELWLLSWSEKSDIFDVRLSIAVPDDEFGNDDSWVKLQWLDKSPMDDYVSNYYSDYPPGAKWSNYLPPPVNIPISGELQLRFTEDDGHAAHYLFGTPIMGDPTAEPPRYLPSHGVYPTWFAEVWMGTVPTATHPEDDIWDTVTDDGVGVHWAPPDDNGEYPYDTAPGVIYRLAVTVEGFSKVHFDAHDGLYNANGKHYKTVFCPFSHDLATPEPASAIFLLATVSGIAGAAAMRGGGRARR